MRTVDEDTKAHQCSYMRHLRVIDRHVGVVKNVRERRTIAAGPAIDGKIRMCVYACTTVEQVAFMGL